MDTSRAHANQHGNHRWEVQAANGRGALQDPPPVRVVQAHGLVRAFLVRVSFRPQLLSRSLEFNRGKRLVHVALRAPRYECHGVLQAGRPPRRAPTADGVGKQPELLRLNRNILRFGRRAAFSHTATFCDSMERDQGSV